MSFEIKQLKYISGVLRVVLDRMVYHLVMAFAEFEGHRRSASRRPSKAAEAQRSLPPLKGAAKYFEAGAQRSLPPLKGAAEYFEAGVVSIASSFYYANGHLSPQWLQKPIPVRLDLPAWTRLSSH